MCQGWYTDIKPVWPCLCEYSVQQRDENEGAGGVVEPRDRAGTVSLAGGEGD